MHPPVSIDDVLDHFPPANGYEADRENSQCEIVNFLCDVMKHCSVSSNVVDPAMQVVEDHSLLGYNTFSRG